MHHRTEVAISASAERVWAALADVERWPEWTPSVEHVEILGDGPFGEGSTVRIKQPRLPSMVWEVAAFAEGRSFTWSTNPGGITTVAEHALSPEVAGIVTVTLDVRQTGPLALLAAPFAVLTRRFIDMEALGLKHRCEASDRPD